MRLWHSYQKFSATAHRLQRALNATIVSCLIAALLACAGEEPELANAAPGADSAKGGELANHLAENVAPPAACEAGQAMIETGYQNFPGKECAEIARLVEAAYTTRIGYRKQCQQRTGAASRPESVARVQVSECGPLRDQDGHYASMRVCCAEPVAAPPPRVITYKVKLRCPDDRVRALATDLHYPAMTCGEAVPQAQSSLEGNAYKRACMDATPGSQTRPTISDAAVFTCREEAGAILDVAVCCSAKAPPGQQGRSIEVPADLWETLRTSDLLGLELLLSRHPGRAMERGPHDITPLHRAGTLPLVGALLAKEADVDARDADGSTPLHYAVRDQLYAVAARLLEVGANVDAANKHGDTALSFAASEELADLLLAHQANPDGSGFSAGPLHSAAFYGRTGVARLLLAHGADANRIDANGETPLHRAAFRQHPDIVRLLLENGAKVNVPSGSGRPRTAMDMTENPEIVALIQSHGGVSGKQLTAR